jgi:cytoskeletal protein RodZ
MSTPTRRHSRAVYRRRRLVLLLGLVLIAALVWLFIAQPWRSWAATGDAEPASSTSQSPSPTASATTPPPDADADVADDPAADETDAEADAEEDAGADEPSPSATPAVEPCTRSELEVVAGTDKDSYATGENPQLTITLTNRSTVACTLNVGTSAQTFEVSSGSDVWWRSTDCQAKPSDMTVTIAAGQSVSSAKPLTWDRTRSSVDSCKSETRPQAPGGGATYHLDVSIGGVHSETTKAFMLY